MKRKLFLEAGFVNIDKQQVCGPELLFVSRLYSRFIAEIDIKDLRKIAISLVDTIDAEYTVATHKLTQVFMIYKYFKWEEIREEKTDINKFNLILNFISETVLQAADEFNWPQEPFLKFFQDVILTDFKNETIVLPPKSSKDKRYKASVITNSRLESVDFKIHLVDNLNKSESYFDLWHGIFHLDEFSRIAYKISWINNEEFVISDKNEEINFQVNAASNDIHVYLTPKTHDIKYLEDELIVLSSETKKRGPTGNTSRAH